MRRQRLMLNQPFVMTYQRTWPSGGWGASGNSTAVTRRWTSHMTFRPEQEDPWQAYPPHHRPECPKAAAGTALSPQPWRSGFPAKIALALPLSMWGLTKMASKSSTAFGLGAMRVTGTCGCGPDTEVPQMAVQQRNGNRDGQMCISARSSRFSWHHENVANPKGRGRRSGTWILRNGCGRLAVREGLFQGCAQSGIGVPGTPRITCVLTRYCAPRLVVSTGA